MNRDPNCAIGGDPPSSTARTFEDYRTFLQRPDAVADTLDDSGHVHAVVVHSDLRQFYDRVAPQLLAEKLRRASGT